MDIGQVTGEPILGSREARQLYKNLTFPIRYGAPVQTIAKIPFGCCPPEFRTLPDGRLKRKKCKREKHHYDQKKMARGMRRLYKMLENFKIGTLAQDKLAQLDFGYYEKRVLSALNIPDDVLQKDRETYHMHLGTVRTEHVSVVVVTA